MDAAVKNEHPRYVSINVIRINKHNLSAFIDILRYESKKKIKILLAIQPLKYILYMSYILTFFVADSMYAVIVVASSCSSKYIKNG